MIKKKNIWDILKVVVSNFLLLLSGIVTSFVLPKILPLSEYGLYKIFNLYTTYIIILQFGIVEGIYIKYGGKKLSDVNGNKFSGYLKALIVLQVLISMVLLAVGLLFFTGEYRFICLALSVDLIVVNLTNIYQYLSQAIQRFTELSIRNIAKSVLTVLAVFLFWIVEKNQHVSYKLYIIFLILINAVLLFWYMKTYRNITFCKGMITTTEFAKVMKVGFPLCLSNIISTLILSIDRQVVMVFFSTAEYAIYSFAYSMLTLISTVVSSISVVLFAHFKQKGKKELLATYGVDIKTVSTLISLMAIVYFPLVFIVSNFLPVYEGALNIFCIIIPGLMITGPISIVMQNYYKVLDHNFDYFKKSVVVLIISFIANMIAYFSFGTMESISFASVCAAICWYIYMEYFLKRKYCLKPDYNLAYLMTMLVVFYSTSRINSWLLGGACYVVVWLLISYLFNREWIGDFVKKIIGRFERRN